MILASPATRTLQTAQLVAAAVDYPRDAIALERRLYLAEPAEHRRGHRSAGCLRSSRCSSSATTRASRELVHDLLPSFDVDDLPTGAVVALEYAAADDWADVEHAVSRLTYYDFPKNSREPATTR